MTVSTSRAAPLAHPVRRPAVSAAEPPWPRLPCLLGALLASGGMWLGLIALGRLLFAG
jgi:hypothetical protein